MEGAVALSLEKDEPVVVGQSMVCGLEVPDAVDVMEEASDLLLFLEWVGFDGPKICHNYY